MSETGIKADWIAVDWGTSNLRCYAMSRSGTVLAQASSPKGMGQLAREDFEPALLELIGPWLAGPTDVIACGMVGSRQGWVEAPYSTAPCPVLPDQVVMPPCDDPRLKVRVISGVQQIKPNHDVMRGEETQIAGFLSLNKDWDGVVCLPGTHTKWVHISANEIISFRTFMTGEMFNLLSQNSVLKHSVGGAGWDDLAFAEGLELAMSRPETLAANLFSIRAADLLTDQTPHQARAKLSGLLIGAELAASKPYWLGQNVCVLGADGLSKIYTDALQAQAVPVTQTDGTRMTLAGLTAAHAHVKETV
ncbi:2-dehydro-3-deoxygalactonokinase [Algirhabdus cladophorae]|uniref:2-dehydro-3-deoxygalactonokinase n=1 Tax=Algirhabdus cladophorae TaxID=3377108 RepID=UPI003B8474C0